MSETTIEWTATRLKDGTIIPGFSFNPWIGCSKVSPACNSCYAERMGLRLGVKWGKGEARRPASESKWKEPLAWNRKAKRLGYRLKVFCASMADVFDDEAPEGLRERLWALIKATPNLDWMLLTKRIQNARKMLPADWGNGYPNVWLGVTCENQHRADIMVSEILKIPAAIRFLSVEPMLGRVDLCEHLGMWWNQTAACFEGVGSAINRKGAEGFSRPGIGLVICGGESGPGARPMHPEWARSLRDQCLAAGVPFFFKQHGSYVTEEQAPDSICLPREYIRPFTRRNEHTGEDEGDQTGFFLVGKKEAGRLLDGREHNDMPSINGGLV